ncbi:hypothetical protein C7B14_25905 [Escherichia coli]|nr:hypothetical protein C7B14_25905 [Escherichia coli]
MDAFFRRASSAAHTNDRGLITVDLFCCTGAIAGQVPAVAYFHERRSLNNFHRDRVITFEQIAE